MVNYEAHPGRIAWEDHLFGLSAVGVLGCALYIWQDPHPYTVTIPEVVVPLVLSLWLGVYTLYLKRRNTATAYSELMVKYGWTGTLVAGAIGAGELILYVFSGLSTGIFLDGAITFLSIGMAAGVLVGHLSYTHTQSGRRTARDRVIVETSWTNRDHSMPITRAIVEALGESDEEDPLDLDPLYEYIDPTVFSELRQHDGTPWQVTWYTDDHEIRVSSHGTITVYE